MRPDQAAEPAKYGRLAVLGVRRDQDKRRTYWLCRCDCGAEREFLADNISRGRVVSCGCHRLAIHTKHGLATRHDARPEHRVWWRTVQICHNPKHPKFARYGGRGIAVCERWRASFANFWADMGECPGGLVLRRIDESKGYEPGNCVWSRPNTALGKDPDRQQRQARAASHGHSGGGKTTHVYNTWRTIRLRCHNKKDPDYPRYGGRGIRVCARWRKDFRSFLFDMGVCPPGCVLKRIDESQGYEPSNCAWMRRAGAARNGKPITLEDLD